MSLTATQLKAIGARGNVLVVAGAGTGKTRTLVERCLACLLSERPRVSIDEILMVTFTEAAAAEMRQRIRDRLEEERQRSGDHDRWQEQLALFETAHIGTLHSFCFQLVRQHFYQLELDPQLSVLAEQEARLLAEETLDTLLQRHYSGRNSAAQAVQRLIQTQARGWDKPIRALILRLHHYAQTLPNPAEWVDGHLALFAAPEPATWRRWLLRAAAEFRGQWLPLLESLSTSNETAARCSAAVRNIPVEPLPNIFASILQEIDRARKLSPRGKKALWLVPLDPFFAEVDFLTSLIAAPRGQDPLAEDWAWVRDQMTTLLELSREFSQSFAEAKRELGVVDFHDLEQHSLRLLWDNTTRQPTRIAQQWRKKLRFLFVDEYQDINAAQDQIIRALGGDDDQANRFLVGDVKQSIYRFRLANPRIFQDYVEQWSSRPSGTIPLVENFRSKESLLDFVNSVFGMLMHRDLGGVDYDSNAALRFGAPQDRRLLSAAANPDPCVELHLRLKGAGAVESSEDEDEGSEALAEVRDLQEADKEARLVAFRLCELQAQRHQIWDVQTSQFRAVDWRDMAILLRSPAKKVESYAKEFARFNLPLQVARTGFYRSLEISDLLSLLQVLDNPLQDLPALAVLHSPLVGLAADELAEIRVAVPKARFWTALLRWHSTKGTPPRGDDQNRDQEISQADSSGGETHGKVGLFLKRFARWRRLARQGSLSRCLEAVLAETHYASWLLTQPRGEQRRANVQRLLSLAQEFDQFQRQGLFRFLKFVEAQQAAETEPEVAATPAENAVRLMSIHQSKGLEFPVVVVADLGKPFNLADLRAEIILDEEYGLCPQVKPPQTGQRYPSLPYWLARRRQQRELLGEELRLLYVAMTRARDTLVLSGAVAQNQLSKTWRQVCQPDTARLLSARCYTDWLGLWFSRTMDAGALDQMRGQSAQLRWFVHKDSELVASATRTETAPRDATHELALESDEWRELEQRLRWRYPFSAATRRPAKTSVSSLRRQAAVDADPESAIVFPLHRKRRPESALSARTFQPAGDAGGEGSEIQNLTAADVGSAHHKFLQLVSLEHTASPEELMREAQRLLREGKLDDEQLGALDFKALSWFWGSELGKLIRDQNQFVHRELAFTARFSAEELALILGHPHDPSLDGEFVLVQGVADLAVVAPKEIWLLDFKTDQVNQPEVATQGKIYQVQINLYARALSRIYRCPVTKSWLCFLKAKEAVMVETT